MNIQAITVTQEAAKGFYPTPPALADKLLSGIDWPYVGTVLEPSAGKGDLVKAVAQKAYSPRYNEPLNVDCIEIDPYLRSILDYEFGGKREDEISERRKQLKEKESWDPDVHDYRKLTSPEAAEKRQLEMEYTPNLRDVFGKKYYNVDLQEGLAGLHRPISFQRLLYNLKNAPQTEYLMKAGLPVLAADCIYNREAKSLRELTGLGKQFLAAMRESQATFREIQVVAAQRSAKPEDLRHLCARNLDGDSLGLLEELIHFSPFGRVLRYVEIQRELSQGQLKRYKLPYFLRLYRDYLNMAQDLKSDMGQQAVLEPRDLKERHDLLAARVNELKSQPDNERFQKAIDDGLYWWAQEYADADYRVVYPQKRSDLTTEGQRLNHCVGMNFYFENHIRGCRMIFFIRKAAEPDRAYFTAEINVDTGRILQLYGFGDCSAPKDVRAFTEGFARAVLRWKTGGAERRAG